MKEKYFKIWIGYDKFIPITEKELSKALAAHITGGVAILDNASVSGKSITLIEPDYHRAMGFNDGYRLQPEDWSDIKKHCGEYKGYLAEVKNQVQGMITDGKKLLT